MFLILRVQKKKPRITGYDPSAKDFFFGKVTISE